MSKSDERHEHDEATFPHERLDVYQVSRRLGAKAREMFEQLPRGEGETKKQLRRASGGIALLIAEGASRRSPGFKRQRFEEALAEAAEIAAAADYAMDHRLVDEEVALEVRRLARRVGSMLAVLENKYSKHR